MNDKHENDTQFHCDDCDDLFWIANADWLGDDDIPENWPVCPFCGGDNVDEYI